MEDQSKKKEKRNFRPAGRYRYTEQYKMTAQVREDGKILERAEYIGPILEAVHSETEYALVRRFTLTGTVLAILSGVLLLTVRGFSVYQGGMYVLVPVTMALFPDLYLALGYLKLPQQDRKLQEDVMHLAHGRICRSCVGIAVLYGLSLALTAFFFLLTGRKPVLPDLLYLVLEAGTLTMCILLRRQVRKLNYLYPRKETGEGS